MDLILEFGTFARLREKPKIHSGFNCIS